MDYFDDLNPYMVRQQEPQSLTGDAPAVPPVNPGVIGQAFLGNIIKLNVGKLGTFYFSYNGSNEWRDKKYVGIIEDAGRDYFIIKEPNGPKRLLLSYVYLLWSEFDEELDFQFSYQ
ncbi:spore coat protein GerQ [Thomasclavelia sp.]